tara:strand:+ start:542 stop:793 length:252 start_codon:yes stop_codon:yes gene_type:complete
MKLYYKRNAEGKATSLEWKETPDADDIETTKLDATTDDLHTDAYKQKLANEKTKKETDKANAISKLKGLGLTDDEAKAYIGEE